MKFISDFLFSCVIWLSSVGEGEIGPSRRMTEDMESFCSVIGVGFQRIELKNKKSLETTLDELIFNAKKIGMKPILHFDMHGSKDAGLFISNSNEYASWSWLAEKFRELNIAMENNLCVIGAACFGIRAIMPIKLDSEAPFFLLLAPEDEVQIGFLEDNIVDFYRCLFDSGSIDTAYSRYLSDQFKYFHCEKMLFNVVARYINNQCKGKSRQTRRETLLTEILLQNKSKSKERIKEVRLEIKKGLKPDQSLIDKYTKKFLINKNCSFNIDQLMAYVEK
jgi:hypothetical protein